MKNRIKNYLSNKSGMTLVEVLTAMAILSLIIFCFTPLFLNYYKTITLAGEKIAEVNTQSGIMQTVIGVADTSTPTSYSAPIAEMALSLKVAQNTSVYRGDSQKTVNAGASITMGEGKDIEDITGNFLFSDKDDLLNSYVTVNSAGSGAAFTCYPSSLTDDFYKAPITLCATGFTIGDNPEFTITCDGGNITLDEGSDYTVKKINNKMVVITFFGGGDVSFETSPVIVEYGSFDCEIEVDAPSMIMVGEANSKGEYHYYVSRGEVDADTDSLIVIQRKMNSTDPKNNNSDVELTSAMNDVEWVPAESSDGQGVAEGQEYGYYVMCGDNGQIRRFWKNSTTGNYYWGGDYTNYTDINEDEVDADNSHYYSESEYSTTANYYYVYRGSHSDESKANVLGGYGSMKLLNANTFSINALDKNKAKITGYGPATNVAAYLPSGEVYYYSNQNNDGNNYSSKITTRKGMFDIYNNATINGGSDGHRLGKIESTVDYMDRYWGVNLALDWRSIKDNSVYYLTNGYTYDYNGETPEPNMITLTSVDAIVMADADSGVKKTHYSTSDDEAQGIDTIEYPTSSYTLYCGYIPAVMDVWSNHSKYDGVTTHDDAIHGGGNYKDGTYSNLTSSINNDTAFPSNTTFTLKKSDSDFISWPKWKGTFGIVAWAGNDGDGNDDEDYEARNAFGYADMVKAHYAEKSVWVPFTTTYYYGNVNYYAFNNVNFAPVGKVFDSSVPTSDFDLIVGSTYDLFVPEDSSRLVIPKVFHVGTSNTTKLYMQANVTAGEVIDITLSYLSHPLAIARTLNPTDDRVYDLTNNRGKNSGNTRTFYWNNIRESATYLDCASTVVPAGEYDVPVSLMVGYVQGGIAEYTGNGTTNDAFINTIMPNGIVLLRAGTSETGTHTSDNVSTGEDKATDALGYQLQTESNAFHQFYYLNSRSNYSTDPIGGSHIGCLSGAEYWLNNRHIQYVASDEHWPLATESTTSTTYNYLRCHPMTNTKVNCVTWGTSWAGNPVAMWGTENGTLLSWKCELNDDDDDGETALTNDSETAYNDRSVVAEFQAYHWVDRVNGKTFKVHDSNWAGSVGSSGSYSDIKEGFKTQSGATFSIGSNNYWDFYDSCSRIRAGETISKELQAQGINFLDRRWTLTGISFKDNSDVWKNYGFISTLDSINDVGYANDTWVAVGDQSGKNPATYCGGSKKSDESGTMIEAYSGTGGACSYVNVCYWIDTNKDANHRQTTDNRNYQWKAVKIDSDPLYNIVQINCLNGMWIATGYYDANDNNEYDDGEKPAIFWTYDPRLSCDEEGGWSSDVIFYKNTGNGIEKITEVKTEVGAINSCATRTED